MKIIKGCPVCGGTVFGTKETGYYCRKCNLLFQSRHVNFKYTKELLKRKIAEHFSEYSGEKFLKKPAGSKADGEKAENNNKPNINDSETHKAGQEAIIPKVKHLSKEEMKQNSFNKSLDAVKTLRKIDGYGSEDDKPAILEFINEQLKKFKEQEQKRRTNKSKIKPAKKIKKNKAGNSKKKTTGKKVLKKRKD